VNQPREIEDSKIEEEEVKSNLHQQIQNVSFQGNNQSQNTHNQQIPNLSFQNNIQSQNMNNCPIYQAPSPSITSMSIESEGTNRSGSQSQEGNNPQLLKLIGLFENLHEDIIQMKQDQANMVNYMNTLARDIKNLQKKKGPQTDEDTSAVTTRSRGRGRGRGT